MPVATGERMKHPLVLRIGNAFAFEHLTQGGIIRDPHGIRGDFEGKMKVADDPAELRRRWRILTRTTSRTASYFCAIKYSRSPSQKTIAPSGSGFSRSKPNSRPSSATPRQRRLAKVSRSTGIRTRNFEGPAETQGWRIISMGYSVILERRCVSNPPKGATAPVDRDSSVSYAKSYVRSLCPLHQIQLPMV